MHVSSFCRATAFWSWRTTAATTPRPWLCLEGAEVVERHEPERRGKGYALAFGARHLGQNPPEILIVLDADCRLGREAVGRLARAAHEFGRPVQARYRMLPPDGAGAGHRLAAFAFLMRNHVRALGLRALGAPCHLMGTGMAIPWPLAVSADLASGHLTEDLKLGVELAAAGKGAIYLPEAVVTSAFPLAAAAASGQHRRWEQGSLQVLASQAPGLLATALARRDAGLLALAFDILAPPIGLYAGALLAWTALLLVLAAAGAGSASIVIPVGALVLLALAIGLAWRRFGGEVSSARDFAGLPSYVLGKLGIYAGLLRGRGSSWTRTDRE